MLSLYRTLSLRYLSRRWFRALLVVSSIMLGVATLVATQALSETMSKTTLASSNPMAGTIDLIVSNATLHWISDHDRLLERLTGMLSPGPVTESCPAPTRQHLPSSSRIRPRPRSLARSRSRAGPGRALRRTVRGPPSPRPPGRSG